MSQQRSELGRNIRARIIETLEMISSKDSQLEYQRNAPIADVSSELFNQWEDWYQPDKDRSRSFSNHELDALAHFQRIWYVVAEATPKYPPPIEKFQKTKEWEILSNAARETLSRLELGE